MAIVKAVASNVYMNGIYCGNSYGGLGLIQILNGSILNLNNSTFKYNGNLMRTLSAITVKFNSIAKIDSSSFIKNYAYTGGSLYCGINSSLAIENSTFHYNTAWKGGAIVCEDTIKNMKVIERIRNYPQCVIKNSEFHANHGIRTGGVFHFESKVVTISNCTFTANEALFFGGVIYAFKYCTIEISNTAFLQSFVAVGSHIFVQDSVTMIIEDSRFHPLRNFVLSGSLIFATERCSITITRSQFMNIFKGPSYSIALNINNHSSTTVENSTFNRPISAVVCQ